MLAAAEPVVVNRQGSRRRVLPALIVDAGPDAVTRFLEFLRGADRECEDAGGVRAGRGTVSGVVRGARPRPRVRVPLHVAAYIRTHPGSVPTVKQHLAAGCARRRA